MRKLVALERWEGLATTFLLGEASQGWLGLEPTGTPEGSLLPGRGNEGRRGFWNWIGLSG